MAFSGPGPHFTDPTYGANWAGDAADVLATDAKNVQALIDAANLGWKQTHFGGQSVAGFQSYINPWIDRLNSIMGKIQAIAAPASTSDNTTPVGLPSAAASNSAWPILTATPATVGGASSSIFNSTTLYIVLGLAAAAWFFFFRKK